MSDHDLIRLRHMLEFANEGLSLAQGRTRIDLNSDRLFALGITKAIEIIGEAARQISPETRARYPQIPWALIIGMRHRLVHAYYETVNDILWNTITNDLPH